MSTPINPPDHDPSPVKDTAEDALERLPDTATETTELSERIWFPERLLESLSGLILLALTLFITVTVVMRFFGNGVLGAVEISALLMVVVTVLVAPAATAADDNFKVEILDMFNKPTLVRVGQLIGAVVQLIVTLFLAFSALELLLYDWSTKTTMAGELAIPRYWLSLAVFVGFVVLLHAAALFLVRMVRSKGRSEGSASTAASAPSNAHPEGV